VFCNNCGASNADVALYCERCGLPVSGGPQSTISGAASASTFPPHAQNNPPGGHAHPYVDGRIRGGAPAPANAIYATGKSPFLALLLSFVIPGVGQFYNGDIKRGMIMFCVSLFFSLSLLMPLIGIPVVLALHIWSMANAYSVAAQKIPLG
jgi:TM2 domain-containing membrane protein YozV